MDRRIDEQNVERKNEMRSSTLLITAFFAMSSSVSVLADSTTQVPIIKYIAQSKAMTVSLQVMSPDSDQASLQVKWVSGGEMYSDKDSVYLNKRSVTEYDLVDVNSWQAPLVSDAIGYQPQVLTSDLPMTSLFSAFYEDFSTATLPDGSIRKLNFDSVKISADGWNVTDLGPQSACIQKQTRSSKPYFAIVACPTK
jgi:hypothetical protein